METFPVPRAGDGHQILGYTPRNEWPRRGEVLGAFLRNAKPRYIVIYGKGLWASWDNVFGDGGWDRVRDHVEGKVWENNTVVVKAPFFGQGKFNRDWIVPICRWMRDAYRNQVG